jgi:methylmalonyl-CoA/ethylmalonyl-CoA epimerase
MEIAKFDHVAHASSSIRAMLPLYRDVLSGEYLHGADNVELGFRTIQLGFAAGTKIELMEPLQEGGGLLANFLQRHPHGGLHHVTYRVPDVRRSVNVAQSFGFKILAENYARPEWQEAFLQPSSAHGALIQLAQSPSNFPRQVPGETLDDILGP